MFVDLTLPAQTAYAQLVESLLSASLTRCVANVPGSFATKTVKKTKYWYYQFRLLDGSLKQVYLGPHTEQLARLIAERELKSTVVANTEQQTTALARHCLALGCDGFLPLHLKIVNKLSDEGFFSAGGLLIGTHAYLAAGNMLGVTWGSSERTQDIDFAHAGKSVSLALPANAEFNLHAAIDSLAMGFTPASSLQGIRGGSWVHPTDPSFRLDFLTTMDRTESPLVHLPAFGAEFQALRYMEFSMQGTVQAAAIARTGKPCLVNIPDPARMAIHKLIVSGLRKGAFAVKANKDIAQAAAIIKFYSERSPGDIRAAYDDALNRGPNWRAALLAGSKRLSRQFPDVKIA